MGEVFALQKDPRAPGVIGQSARERQRRGPAYEVAHQLVELSLKLLIAFGPLIGRGELIKRGDERLRHIPPAVLAEATGRIGKL